MKLKLLVLSIVIPMFFCGIWFAFEIGNESKTKVSNSQAIVASINEKAHQENVKAIIEQAKQGSKNSGQNHNNAAK